jgi:hypothetical protein
MPQFSAAESTLLRLLRIAPFLPICRFVLKTSRSAHLSSVALEPVFLAKPTDTLQTVQANAAALKHLASLGIIVLDYDIPIINCDYTDYKESQVFKYFEETVAEGGKRNPAFLFDTADLECGSLALTDAGQAFLDILNASFSFDESQNG